MKRFLLLTAAMGLLSILSATPGDHKIYWCHYPPGQWTGDPATSKAIILYIDVAGGPSPSLVPPHHENHEGDGPATGDPPSCGAEG